MNSKLLMTTSAVLLGAVGIILSFFPDEIDAYPGIEASGIVLQLLGAAYFAFAMVNWTGRANLIGGIYSRAVSIGNFTHFTIAALALVKWVLRHQASVGFVVAAVIFSAFALLFGSVLFTHPRDKG